MNAKPISDAARKAAEEIHRIFKGNGIHSSPDRAINDKATIIQAAIDEETKGLTLKAADRDDWQEVALSNKEQLEQWKACAERLVAVLKPACKYYCSSAEDSAIEQFFQLKWKR